MGYQMTKVERDFPFIILKELEANDVSNTFNVPKCLVNRLKNFYDKPANIWLSLSGQFVTGIQVVYQLDGLLFNGADWEVVVGRYKLKEKHLMEFIDIRLRSLERQFASNEDVSSGK
ncbi:hypothetical protein TorRG33x02_123060 [Trema orientale]|uniref:Uncharacterized protein n=1 Tax=Trema orientale TaxID=63057 RepID=A0A2P5F2G6_TREOI|nr:hypothetical protein TorRG33x02_123060 [Trema orientale]